MLAALLFWPEEILIMCPGQLAIPRVIAIKNNATDKGKSVKGVKLWI